MSNLSVSPSPEELRQIAWACDRCERQGAVYVAQPALFPAVLDAIFASHDDLSPVCSPLANARHFTIRADQSHV